jgi:transposase
MVEVLYPCCAGLDVHKDSIVACARLQEGVAIQHEVETFGTTTSALLTLADWLTARKVSHVAMEATGVYWRPPWHILEDSFTLVLANAMHIKNVPGRKTDVNDATWIADLLAHGLIRSSFVPPQPIQELRALMRTRKQLVRERGQHVQRIQKTLEDTNLKIASVVSDITGTSGRAILRALITGETDPEKLLAVTTGRLRADRTVLLEALRGHVRPHHRFLLKLHLDQVEAIEAAIAAVDAEVETHLDPFREDLRRLSTIPGVGPLAAQVILSEVAVDMSRFPTVGQLISWAGLCPRNDESAGKRRSTRLRQGSPWLKELLVQCAWAAVRVRKSYLRAQFLRLKSRRGPQKAIVAVAASILTAVYFILRDGVDHYELGADYFDRSANANAAARLVRRLKELGYEVDLKAVA